MQSGEGNYQLPRPQTLEWKSPEEQERSARLSRYLLVFMKNASTAVPGFGPLIAGGLEVVQRVADDAEAEQLQQRIERLLAGDERIESDLDQLRDDLKVLTTIAFLSLAKQHELIEWLAREGQPVAAEELTAVALNASLTAYRERVALDFRYLDHRGIQEAGRAAHVTSLLVDEVYVLPRLLPEETHFEASEREVAILKLLDDPDLPAAQRAKLDEEYTTLTGERWRPSPPAVVRDLHGWQAVCRR